MSVRSVSLTVGMSPACSLPCIITVYGRGGGGIHPSLVCLLCLLVKTIDPSLACGLCLCLLVKTLFEWLSFVPVNTAGVAGTSHSLHFTLAVIW